LKRGRRVAMAHAAQALKIELQSFAVRSSAGFGHTFEQMAPHQIEALVVSDDWFVNPSTGGIVELSSAVPPTLLAVAGDVIE